MENGQFNLSTEAEAKLLALLYMSQKSLTDDTLEDVAREYQQVRESLTAALKSR